jgi:hypothetical protein
MIRTAFFSRVTKGLMVQTYVFPHILGLLFCRSEKDMYNGVIRTPRKRRSFNSIYTNTSWDFFRYLMNMIFPTYGWVNYDTPIFWAIFTSLIDFCLMHGKFNRIICLFLDWMKNYKIGFFNIQYNLFAHDHWLISWRLWFKDLSRICKLLCEKERPE